MQTLRPNSGFPAGSQKHISPNPAGAGLVAPIGTTPPASPAVILAKIAAPCVIVAGLWSQIWIGTGTACVLTVLMCIVLYSAAYRMPDFRSQGSILRLIAYGERIWLNRIASPVPPQLNQQITVLNLVFLVGLLSAITGGFLTSPILTATGLAVCYAAQFVYFSKLNQLYQAMREKNALYRFWAISPNNDNTCHSKTG